MPLPDHRRRLDDAVAWPPGRCRRPAQPRRSERCHWPPPPARPTAAAAVAVDVPGVSTGGGPGGPCPPSPPTSLAALSRPQHRGCCVSGRRRCRPPLHPCNPPRLSVPASQTTLATGFSDVHLPRLAPLMKPRPPRQATVAAASCNPPPPPQTALAPSRKPRAVGVALAPSPSNRPAGPCTPPRHLAPAVGAQPRRGAGHACRHLLRPTHRQPQYNPPPPPPPPPGSPGSPPTWQQTARCGARAHRQKQRTRRVSGATVTPQQRRRGRRGPGKKKWREAQRAATDVAPTHQSGAADAAVTGGATPALARQSHRLPGPPSRSPVTSVAPLPLPAPPHTLPRLCPAPALAAAPVRCGDGGGGCGGSGGGGGHRRGRGPPVACRVDPPPPPPPLTVPAVTHTADAAADAAAVGQSGRAARRPPFQTRRRAPRGRA